MKAAIIGCGGRGRIHAAGYKQCEDVEIVALADPVAASAQKLGEDHNVSAIYDDYETMLREAKPDIVSICTWPNQHHDQVLAAIRCGARAIHSEKPIAPTWGEARAMHQAAQQAGVQLTYCHQRRFSAQFVKARELAQSGAIGEIFRIEGYCPNLFDWGTHWFDMMFYFNRETPAQWVMGQIDTRAAHTVFGAWVESNGLSYIRFQNDVYGLMMTGDGAEQRVAIRVMGTEGTIELTQSDNENLRFRRDGEAWQIADLSDYRGGFDPQADDWRSFDYPTALSVIDAVKCLRNGQEPELSSRRAMQATELIFATYESSRQGARIDLPLEIDDSPLAELIERHPPAPKTA